MRVFEMIASGLVARGLTRAFTLMSEDSLRLMVELRRGGVSVYHTRHEAGAIGMAHGYARASGSVGLAVVGRGPAFTNALTLVINAARDRTATGLLVICGDSPVSTAHRQMGTLKYIDQGGILKMAGVPSITLTSADSACADFALAHERARAGGIVVVNLPTDVAMAEAGGAAAQVALPPLLAAPAADPQRIAVVADLLTETWAAKRPVIVAGRGAVLARALPALVRLGDRIGALMATTLLGKSAFRGDPFDVGVLGTMARPLTNELAARADLLLAFGASLHPHTTWRGEGSPRARIVRVDIDPSALEGRSATELTLLADAGDAATALCDELDRRGHRSVGYRDPETAGRIAEAQQDDGIKVSSRASGLDPRLLIREIDRILPADRAVVIEAGHCTSFIGSHLSASDPEAFYFPHGFGSIAASLGFALGATIARPDRLTVHAGGDGSFMMAVNEIDTAVRYRLPTVFLVINDHGFGAEAHSLEVNGIAGDIARYDNPPLEAVARGLGADGMTIRSLADVGVLRSRIERLTGPLVVDCEVDPQVQAEYLTLMVNEPRRSTQRPAG